MASAVADTLSTAASAVGPTPRVNPQGGIFDKANPSQYDSKNPITLFIIQVVVIIVFCRLLHYPLSKIRQPRVISEVIGGILLGPSVMGRIPGFREAIFPDESLPNLNLVANLGLVLFLFMIGVETNVKSLMSNWRVAVSVSAAGMVLPFGLGCAVAYGLYHQFRGDPTLAEIDFGTYMLFIGIAMAITAFPVLCRILTELELLNSRVGLIVLSAGVGNDVVGWILLALCVALVNAGSGITAVWVLLSCVGFTLFLGYAVRPCFLWYLKRSGSLHDGPNQTVVSLTLLLALAAAFFTQVIGVHAIFGGFMVGIICPHDGGFAIKLTEKIEDLIGALFLPLYFALSGLSTNIGLLDTGLTWGYVVAVTVIAFVAKVGGGAIASRLTGLLWRESFAVGVLMSCKGLVELVVLNIGLEANILTTRTFTIFVVMALVTTFLTTPCTLYLYPEWYRTKVESWRRGEIDWDGNPLESESGNIQESHTGLRKKKLLPVEKLLVYLRLDNLPGLFTFVSLLGLTDGPSFESSKLHHSREDKNSGKTAEAQNKPVEAHALRLVELTDRDSSVMKVSTVHDYSLSDPILNTFRAFGQLNKVTVSGGVIIAPEHAYAETVVNQARDFSSDLLLVPWSETGGMSETQIPLLDDTSQKFSTGVHSSFVANVLKNSKSNIGLFVNKGFVGPSLSRSYSSRSLSGISTHRTNDLATVPSPVQGHHIFFPYFGGYDDQFALRLVLQLAKNTTVTVTVAYIALNASENDASTNPLSDMSFGQKESDTTFYNSIRDSLPTELSPRVVFQTINTSSTDTIKVVLETAKLDLTQTKNTTGDLVIVGRSSIAASAVVGRASSAEIGSEAKKALGTLGEVMVGESQGVQASVLVVQASQEG